MKLYKATTADWKIWPFYCDSFDDENYVISGLQGQRYTIDSALLETPEQAKAWLIECAEIEVHSCDRSLAAARHRYDLLKNLDIKHLKHGESTDN